jgi:WD40 repeat protein
MTDTFSSRGRESEPVAAGHGPTWPVFICYRQDDGKHAARWLAAQLAKRTLPFIPDGYDAAPSLEVYFDQDAPAVEDWTKIHQPALERARAFLLVCSPGAMIDFGEGDWVQAELRWWLEHRANAPLIIDCTNSGDRYVPLAVKAKWPHAQRTVVVPDQWELQLTATRQAAEDSAVTRILGGIRASEISVRYADLERERERVKLLEEQQKTLENQRNTLAAQGERLRKQRTLVTALLVIATIAAVSAGYALMLARSEARVSNSKSLAIMAANEIRTGDQGKALDLALEAWRNSQTTEAHDAIAAAFPTPPILLFGKNETSVSFSKDGLRIVTAGTDEVARIWDARNGREVHQLVGHSATVRTATFSPDGRQIVTAGKDKFARLWDAGSGREVHPPLGHMAPVETATFSPDGRQIVTICEDETAQVWNLNGEKRDTLRHPSASVRVKTAAFSPDGQQLVTTYYDDNGPAHVWKIGSGQPPTILKGHRGRVEHAVFLANGQQIATVGHDGTLRLWDVGDANEVDRLEGHIGRISSVQQSRDGYRLVTASDDGTARVWDVHSGKELATLNANIKGDKKTVISAQFSPDGRWVLTGGVDGTARLWDAQTGRELARLGGHNGSIESATFSPDGWRVATASGEVRLWNVQSGQAVITLPGHGEDAIVTFSPDGKHLLTVGNDKIGRISDANNGKELWTKEHDVPLRSATYSKDGRFIITATDSGEAILWDATWKLLKRFHHEAAVSSATFSSDGQRIVTVGAGTVRLHSRDGPESATAEEFMGFGAAAFSPDGERLVIAGLHDLRIRNWDVRLHQWIDPFYAGHTLEVSILGFSADGERIVSAGKDRTVRLWNAGTGEPLKVFEAHSRITRAVVFSPDSRLIATAGDPSARIWNAQSLQLLTAVEFDTLSPVFSVAFSPDSHRLAVATRKQVRIYQLLTLDDLARILNQ